MGVRPPPTFLVMPSNRDADVEHAVGIGIATAVLVCVLSLALTHGSAPRGASYADAIASVRKAPCRRAEIDLGLEGLTPITADFRLTDRPAPLPERPPVPQATFGHAFSGGSARASQTRFGRPPAQAPIYATEWLEDGGPPGRWWPIGRDSIEVRLPSSYLGFVVRVPARLGPSPAGGHGRALSHAGISRPVTVRVSARACPIQGAR